MTIPQALLDRRQWLIWTLEKDPKRPEKKKLLKVPYYVDGGRRYGLQGNERDRRRLAVHAAAVKAAPASGLELGNGGVGLAFLPDDGLIGIDLDNAIDADGVISPRAVEIIKRCDSFTEYSPSGKGLHIYVAGKSETNTFDPIGVEIYCGGQYFTVTGKHYAGTPLEVREISPDTLRWLHGMIDGEKEAARQAKKAAAAPAAAPRAAAPSKASVASIDNDFKRVNDAAMRNLAAWVPALLPAAVVAPMGYRVSSRDLGRDLEEDLSITTEGIVDWGLHDQGDAREGRRTPIDLVMEHSANKRPKEALHWLAGALGIALSSPPPRAPRSQSGGDAGEPPADGDEEGGEPEDELPKIRWILGKLPGIVDQAERHLMKAKDRVYQRAGQLVRIVRRDTPSVRNYSRPPGTLGLHGIEQPYLVEAFTRAAWWEKYNAKSQEWHRINCPDQVAATYLARGGHWKLPKLWSVITAPTLRPDGTVLQKPGYDEKTATWYDPCGVDYPQVPEKPTKEDAERALKLLREVFKTVPFTSAVDEAVLLSLALTALVRRSLPSAPLGAISAPIMASGKTMIADTIAILPMGTPAPAMKLAETDEEAAKTALAVLAEGDPVVLIDNVERPLQGDWLCTILTSETYRQRILGRTEMMNVPTTTLFLATGNHLVIAGDLRTRALLCRIDPKSEHPEQRQFDYDLREHVAARRAELVVAGLTIMRAFIATGEVKHVADHVKPWGRFERWSEMVRAPLVWLECADPCESLSALQNEDPEHKELQRMLHAWHGAFGSDPTTAREAVEYVSGMPPLAESQKQLKEVLSDIARDRGGELNVKKAAKWLQRHVGRRVNGRQFIKADEKDHVALWKVEVLETKAG
jgi:hypothetical protein